MYLALHCEEGKRIVTLQIF